MREEANRVRLLPWTGAYGQPCFLLTDGDGFASRFADRVEDVQLGLADRLLGRTRDVLAEGATKVGELGAPADQLADALSRALRVARSRGARLGGRPTALPGGAAAESSTMGSVHGVLAYRPAGLRGQNGNGLTVWAEVVADASRGASR
ncbi:hypothetical protein [Streptomyces sp. SA15]|uniref:hypothetical protein n=1 Tax=Streptomyces sp. SA15 TaxID=934019 RepID=UPI0015C7B930|nr:hypothetical protein [Streptomyces sp. SA15]